MAPMIPPVPMPPAPLSPPASTAPPRRTPPPPDPLSQSTRRFLKPLIGLDPASVHIQRGEGADRVTSHYGAEGLAAGDRVVVGAGHSSDAPETLGLLAHELTHVARARNPRFVPPVARGSSVHAPDTWHPTERSNVSGAVSEQDEGLARQVEAAVVHQARGVRAALGTVTTPPIPESTPVDESEEVSAPPSTAPKERLTDDDWGGLPAPWEPLPAWMTSPPPMRPPVDSRELPPSSGRVQADLPPRTIPPKHSVSRTATSLESPVQRAETGRSLPVAEISPDLPPQQPTVEPDMDHLARQVYTILKRRLDLERRRSR